MKKLNVLTLLLAIMLCCTLSVSALALAEETTTGATYKPTYAVFADDTFELYNVAHGLTNSEVADVVWKNSSVLYAEGDMETVSKEDASQADLVISGEKSLKWNAKAKSADGWTGVRLGVSDGKLTSIPRGVMIKLTFSVRLVGMKSLVVYASDGSSQIRHASMAIRGDLTEITPEQDAGLIQSDPETSTEVYISADKTWASVGFAFRSPVKGAAYFYFDACVDTEAAENYVIFDDVTVLSEQKPEVDYIPYKAFVDEQFENGVAESLFDLSATANANAAKNVNVDEERSGAYVTAQSTNKAVRGENSAVFYASANAQAQVNSKNISLKANHYKLFFLTYFSGVKVVGINVVNAADDSVVYAFNYNISKGAREETPQVTFFDSSSFTNDTANVYTAYGEFQVTGDTDVYLQIRFDVSNKKASYAAFDDVCLLQGYEYQAIRTTFPESTATKVQGTWQAAYEQIGGTFATAFSVYKGEIGIAGAVLCVGSVCVGGAVSKKKKKYICAVLAALMLVSVAFTAVACANNANTTQISAGWQTVSPQKISGKLDNPGIGWVVLEEPTYGGHIDIGSSGDLPEASLGSLSTTWYHIETKEDEYDWTMCDQAVEYWNKTGRRILLRISTDSCVWPYTYNAAPQYLFDKYNVGYQMVGYSDGGAVTTARVTNMADPVYQERLGKFLNALYEHYKDNPMVETVEIRGFGMWGEWHHGYPYDNTAERVWVLDSVIDNYVGAFADSGKNLVVSCSWDPDYLTTGEYYAGYTSEEAYQNYIEWSAFDKAWRTANVGYRRDGAASALNYNLDERLMAEAFRSGKRVPILGEYANNHYNISSAGSVYTLESALNDLLFKVRPNNSTTLGWVAVEMERIISLGDTDFIDRGNEMMGYRLAVDEALFPTAVSAGSTFTVRTTWSNKAVGIYPYVSPLRLMLLDGNGNAVYTYDDTEFDARTFVLGEINNVYSDITIPKSVANGKYSLAVAIPFEQHSATEHQYIALGMAGETAENSRIYKLGDIEVKNNVKLNDGGIVKTNWKDVNSLKLDGNSTYEVTFKYMPHFDMSNFYFGTNDGYKFSVKQGKEESNVYYWQDISGEAGQKTVTIRTAKGDDAKLAITSENFDKIGVDEVYVEKKGGYYTDFTGYDPKDASTLIMPVVRGSLGLAEDVEMSADCVVLSSQNSEDKLLLAKTDPANVKLKKGEKYTVSFDFRAVADVGDGGYYFVALGDGSSKAQILNDSFKVIGEWYERSDNWDTKKSYSFICTEDGQSVYFGICMPGSYYIDNLTITATKTNVVEGQDIGFKRNVVPTYDIGLNKIETFTKGTFQSCGFNWGQFAWGRMTFKENEIVGVTEGSKDYMNAEVGTKDRCSLLGRIESEAYNPSIDNIWFEFARTKTEYYPFEAGKTYTVEFDYKILKSFESGFIFVFFRDDTLADRFQHVIEVPDGHVAADGAQYLNNGKQVGVDYHFKQTYTIQDYNNYQFMICMKGLWEIAVDNVFIYEGTTRPAV